MRTKFFYLRELFTNTSLTPASPTPNNHFTATAHSTIKGASGLSVILEPASSLISPPPSPSRERATRQTSSPPPSPLTTIMNKSKYATTPLVAMPLRGGQGAPPRGVPGAAPTTAPSSWGTQDARGNLAVQPVASTGTVKLKKAAVKVVGASSVTQARPATAKSPAVSSLVSISKSPEGYVLP